MNTSNKPTLDYEKLPTNDVFVHMLAGATSGIMEHCAMYPIDSIKTRMQILNPDPRAIYKNLFDAFRRISSQESLWITMRGVEITAIGSGPAHAVYFACYEAAKKMLKAEKGNNHMAHGIAGAFATLAHDIAYNPFEVIKQRLQVYNSPYNSWLLCFRSIISEEGWSAFYRSFGTQLIMNIPYQSLHFIVYEFTQDRWNHERVYHPMTHICSGGMAGAVAAAVTTPFDVIKTYLNTREQKTKNADHMLQAAKAVRQSYGWAGFFRGTVARVLFQIPSTAIAWSVYETFKFILLPR